MFEPIKWDVLRWELMTSQLIEIANKFGISIKDMPKNTQRKKWLATKIADYLCIPSSQRGR